VQERASSTVLARLAQQLEPQGAPQSLLDLLPTRTYRASECAAATSDRSDEAKQCMVCLCEYEEGDELRTLPCMHFFHKGNVAGCLAVRGSLLISFPSFRVSVASTICLGIRCCNSPGLSSAIEDPRPLVFGLVSLLYRLCGHVADREKAVPSVQNTSGYRATTVTKAAQE
jgi:hypothetical protein